MSPRLACIPHHLPFLDSLARRWLDRPDPEAAAPGMILLPTRRAARALVEAFLRASGGRVLLLPRIAAVGALDEAPLALAGALDLPPAVPSMRRLAELSRLVLAAGRGLGGAPGAGDAWRLARALAQLQDEAARAETDLAETLPRLAEDWSEAWAEHWRITLRFLRIVTEAWPRWLADNQMMDEAARQVALLRAQAAAWQAQPPVTPLWAAGFAQATPSLTALLRVVAGLPHGRVVFAGLDRTLDDAAFAALPDSHADCGAAQLLAALGARRDDVAEWNAPPGRGAPLVPPGRVAALHTALLPEQALGAWLDNDAPADLIGLAALSPADQQEEAGAIALLLRQALQTPGRRAALITPDRGLAARVVVELTRFGVAVDDSAGEPLAATPPAVLLRLLARACAEDLAPVALLALLKHPLAAVGGTPAHCRALARRLEVACLRGPAPRPGFAGLRARVSGDADLDGFLDDLARMLAPLTARFVQAGPVPVQDLLDALIESAESLAGAETLWSLEEGNALAQHLADLATHVAVLPPQPAAELVGLLDATLEAVAVRSRRALRGRDTAQEHPRLFIWGLLEARLQSVEFAVLGGLVEGVWPAAADSGPWLSRPMRAQAGLPSPEAAIGQAARDFLASACAAPEVVLSCPGRREGAPAVPARWLVRLRAWLRGRGQSLDEHAALGWLRRLDQPSGPARPVPPPAPCPKPALRPRRLSVTEIETWMRDPYAIHARHVLRLRKLAPLEEPADAADYGSIVHAALQAFLERHGAEWPNDAPARLQTAFLAALDAAGLRPALSAWWRPRLLRIASWVAQTEGARRAVQAPSRIGTEIKGEAVISGAPGGDFTLRGRADRIERLADGTLALLDYKTGALPQASAVREGWSSQLVLEAAMARLGGFGADFAGETASLTYWSLSGGHQPGRVLVPVKPAELAALVGECWKRLVSLVAAYDDPAQPYLSQPRPGAAPRFTDYAALARVAEWSAAREESGA